MFPGWGSFHTRRQMHFCLLTNFSFINSVTHHRKSFYIFPHFHWDIYSVQNTAAFCMIVFSVPFTSSPFRILKSISSVSIGCYSNTSLDSFANAIIKLLILSSRWVGNELVSWLFLLHTTVFFQIAITTHW